jgi:hypothetical protein
MKSETLEVLTLRVPKDLIERIDARAADDLLSRSAEVRRTLNTFYGERQRVSA